MMSEDIHKVLVTYVIHADYTCTGQTYTKIEIQCNGRSKKEQLLYCSFFTPPVAQVAFYFYPTRVHTVYELLRTITDTEANGGGLERVGRKGKKGRGKTKQVRKLKQKLNEVVSDHFESYLIIMQLSTRRWVAWILFNGVSLDDHNQVQNFVSRVVSLCDDG